MEDCSSINTTGSAGAPRASCDWTQPIQLLPLLSPSIAPQATDVVRKILAINAFFTNYYTGQLRTITTSIINDLLLVTNPGSSPSINIDAKFDTLKDCDNEWGCKDQLTGSLNGHYCRAAILGCKQSSI